MFISHPMTVKPRAVHCPWPGCASITAFPTELECLAHFKVHQVILLDAWNGPAKCSWPDCSTKAIFKHRSNLKSHITNIHVEPLQCNVPGCSYTRSFGTKCDLTRHISTVHQRDEDHACPVESCDASFARKDKLLKHRREAHVSLKCTWNHCGSIVLEGEEDLHLRDIHGPYECALGACEQGRPSRFSEEGLKQHVHNVHNIHWGLLLVILRIAGGSADKTARDVAKGQQQLSQTDCLVCLNHVGHAHQLE